jgi:glycosyltransferase involved in cell wall biosynthesis
VNAIVWNQIATGKVAHSDADIRRPYGSPGYKASPASRRSIRKQNPLRSPEATRVMFLYWGRRGLTQFALEVARAALANPGMAATISVARQNERFGAFAECGDALFPIDTFATNLGAMTQAWRIPRLRLHLLSRLMRDRTQVVINLMPHVWSSFMASTIRKAGVRYVTFVHDADPHPGDYRTNLVKRVLDRAMLEADLVFTLSEAVSGRLSANHRVPRDKLCTLFHPDLRYTPALTSQPPAPGAPLRLLFMGRIMPYKGLSLFLDAVDILREEHVEVEVGVFGEGSLGTSAARLEKMGAEVVNRWLTETEISGVLRRYHAIVLSHTEASQSGVAAAALGAGLPVVATPVGGLMEQIMDGQTGIVAPRLDARAVAEAIKRLLLNPLLYRMVCQNIAQSKERRSMTRFVQESVSLAVRTTKVRKT